MNDQLGFVVLLHPFKHFTTTRLITLTMLILFLVIKPQHSLALVNYVILFIYFIISYVGVYIGHVLDVLFCCLYVV